MSHEGDSPSSALISDVLSHALGGALAVDLVVYSRSRVRKIGFGLPHVSGCDWREPLYAAAEAGGAVDDPEIALGFHAARRVYERSEDEFESAVAEKHATAFLAAQDGGLLEDDALAVADDAAYDWAWTRVDDHRDDARAAATRAAHVAIMRDRRERAAAAWAPVPSSTNLNRPHGRTRERTRTRARPARARRTTRASSGSSSLSRRSDDPSPPVVAVGRSA